MTVKFVWEHATPQCPHGEDIEVAFDAARRKVVEANRVHNGYPLGRKARFYLGCELKEHIKAVGGWDVFARSKVRVQY